jgi:hypothetical protein
LEEIKEGVLVVTGGVLVLLKRLSLEWSGRKESKMRKLKERKVGSLVLAHHSPASL